MIYWLAENLGTYKQWSSGECPGGKRWVCFEHKIEGRDLETGVYHQDLVKEQIVVKREPTVDPEPVTESFDTLMQGKNLFVDLAERVSGELNVSNCWVCEGTLMAEMWPWKGNSWAQLSSSSGIVAT